jgi:hypothetical protein
VSLPNCQTQTAFSASSKKKQRFFLLSCSSNRAFLESKRANCAMATPSLDEFRQMGEDLIASHITEIEPTIDAAPAAAPAWGVPPGEQIRRSFFSRALTHRFPPPPPVPQDNQKDIFSLVTQDSSGDEVRTPSHWLPFPSSHASSFLLKPA